MDSDRSKIEIQKLINDSKAYLSGMRKEYPVYFPLTAAENAILIMQKILDPPDGGVDVRRQLRLPVALTH